MHSTDTIGWSGFEYQITDDVKISIRTNFGYGNSSYFMLGMSYKKIDILPYSYLVRYYHADMRDLVRYTKLYRVERESWEKAFDYVVKAANMAVNNVTRFIRTYVLDEVKQMLFGMEMILLNPFSYAERMERKAGSETDCEYLTVRNMNIYEKSIFGVYPREMTMVIKSEKISGALDFLDNLSKLSAFLPEIQDAVKQVREMAEKIKPDILSKINALDDHIFCLDQEIADIEADIEDNKKYLAPHEKEIDALYEAAKAENDMVFRSDIQKKYSESNTEYERLRKEQLALEHKYHAAANERNMRDSFRKTLLQCLFKIQEEEEKQRSQ